jgi:hypothetical protein
MVREMWHSTTRQQDFTPRGSINSLPSACAALWPASRESFISKNVEITVPFIVDEGSQPSFGSGFTIIHSLLLKVELYAFTLRPPSTGSVSKFRCRVI